MAGCVSSGGATRSPLVPDIPSAALHDRKARPKQCNHSISCIQHVVIVIQENRSLDNVFGDPAGSIGDLDRHTTGIANCPGMLVKPKVKLRPVKLEYPYDVNHSWASSLKSFDSGKMDGFCYDAFYYDAATLPYAYVPDTPTEARPYWDMASKYVIADHMFPTEFGPSFSSHLMLIAGNDDLVSGDDALVDFPSSTPWGCDAPRSTVSPYIHYNGGTQRLYVSNGPFPCFDQFRTMADTLDAAGISWKYYGPCVAAPGSHRSCDPGGLTWSAFDAIKNVRDGADWANVVTPPMTVLKDAKACRPSSCKFPDVAWVVPDIRDSDHAESPPYNSNTGPSWVASIVNTIHNNANLWSTTAIVVVWDDYGGWSDLAVPPQSPRFGGKFAQGDFRGLGIRVPCLIISPYTYGRQPHVVHTQYEFGSILKFVEEVFNLPTLGTLAAGYTDGRANSIADAFNFHLDPHRGEDISAPYQSSFFLSAQPSMVAPDDK